MVAQERVTRGPEGLVRIGLKKAIADGTVAVERMRFMRMNNKPLRN